jgi:hypothetical protein
MKPNDQLLPEKRILSVTVTVTRCHPLLLLLLPQACPALQASVVANLG